MADTFEQWMKEVNDAIFNTAYVDSRDLPDWHYRDAFDDGMDPKDAAVEVLEEAGWEG